MANEIEIVVRAKDQTSAGFRATKQASEDAAKSLDKLGEAADTTDTRAMGFRDTLTGVQDTLKGTAMLAKGPSFEAFLTLGMGIGDLGSGIFNFVVPAIKTMSLNMIRSAAATVTHTATTIASRVAMVAAAAASKAWAAAQWVLNAALTANPIGLVIAAIVALVAAIVLAYRNSETFRNIVQVGWAAIKKAIGTVVNFIIEAFRLWFNVATTVVSGILRLFGKLPGPMGEPFRKAESAVQSARKTVNTELTRIQQKVNSLTGKDVPISASLKLNFSKTFTQEDWLAARLRVGRMRQGGRIPGFGGGDIYPALLEPGEAVVDKDKTRRFADVLGAMGVPGFQAGGVFNRVGIAHRGTSGIQADYAAAGLMGLTRAIEKVGMIMGGSGSGGGSARGLVGFARTAFYEFRRAFPWITIGGWRARGSVPGSDHPKGKALDLMTTNPVVHAALIAFGKKLDGDKYWISRRRWAHVRDGYRVRPYHGPSPHMDHVHWSFYGDGGVLPEDVVGFGRSGRGYRFHGGEKVEPTSRGGVAIDGPTVLRLADAIAAVLRANPPVISVDRARLSMAVEAGALSNARLG